MSKYLYLHILINIALISVCSEYLFAQQSVLTEIRNVEDSKEVLLLKARKLLTQNFAKKDVEKMAEIIGAMESEFGDSTLIFTQFERHLLNFWISDYDSLFQFLRSSNKCNTKK